jgi:hypothetical protein
MPKTALKGCMYYGKNCSKLVYFNEQKINFIFFKTL